MRYFRQQGKSDHEVIEALNAKFGDAYQIMTRKTVKLGGIFGVGRRTGVEYYGYIKEKGSSVAGTTLSGKPSAIEPSATGSKARSPRGGGPSQVNRDQKNRDEILARFAKNKEVQRLLQENKIVLEEEKPLNNDRAVVEQALPRVPQFEEVQPDPGEQQKSIVPEATFLQRLEELERKVDRRGSERSSNEQNNLVQFRKSLYNNEFPPTFVDRLIDQIQRELPLEALEKMEVLWEYVLLHMAGNMRFLDQKPHSRIMVLVGPTGVGKTTTIAKLAARQCVEAMGGTQKIHLITLDNYRIGAQDQIRTYGEILGAKVDFVETREGLANCIEQDRESDMILIDTMGRSPRDHMKLAEMREFLDSSGDCDIHLTMSATSGVSSMKEIITQFRPFGFRSVILTKLDELGRVGAVLATLLQEDLSLSYLTTGQKVPQDIRPASALALFRQLVDVKLNWESFAQKLEENIL